MNSTETVTNFTDKTTNFMEKSTANSTEQYCNKHSHVHSAVLVDF